MAGLALAWAQPGFESVDQRAIAAPARSERSLDELVRYLCPGRYSEEQKARSIFRWIAEHVVYDVEGLRDNKLGSQQPEDVLRTRRAVCEGYSRLFAAMAEKAGLDATFISGRSSYNDQLPFKLPAGVSGHGWNAILLKGRWRLLDVTWAAGKVDRDAHFKKSFDDFWYLTPPDQFVFTHFPKVERWQMLDRPWSSQRFEASPQYMGEFFRMGLKPPADLLQPLSVRQDSLIRFKAPDDIVAISDLRDSKGNSLENWSFSQSPPGSLEVRLRCPKPGDFRLVVFGRRREAAWQGNLQTPQSYQGLVDIKVRAQSASTKPFPKTYGSFQRGGAELLAPFDGELRAKSRQRFRVRVPGAKEVAFFAGKEYLGKLELKSGVYEGTVICPARGVPLQVCAQYPQELRYWGLVEYIIR